jgi:hypothetical protein
MQKPLWTIYRELAENGISWWICLGIQILERDKVMMLFKATNFEKAQKITHDDFITERGL